MTGFMLAAQAATINVAIAANGGRAHFLVSSEGEAISLTRIGSGSRFVLAVDFGIAIDDRRG